MNEDLDQDSLDGLEVFVIIDDREMFQIRSYKGGLECFFGINGMFILTPFPAWLLTSGMLCSAFMNFFITILFPKKGGNVPCRLTLLWKCRYCTFILDAASIHH